MTREQAKAFVRDHWDDNTITNEQVEDCFRALFGREPGTEDEEGDCIWNLCCHHDA
jgi:hypothetical protein